MSTTEKNSDHASTGTSGKSKSSGLMLAAIGVVFGDIGTSPLYTLKEVFHGSHGIATSHDNVLGALSLVLWALLIVVSLKYVIFIMRADNNGEGGIMALLALTLKSSPGDTRSRWLLMTMGIFGAALFYGDGVITPAISVLSAVEGLKIATPALEPYVIPITLIVLAGLFLFQRKGTASVGALFGPVMIVWFATLALLGIINIFEYPAVLQAVNPFHGFNFFVEHQWYGFLALGAVVLAVTGGEALYADMGHFGRMPIKTAWFFFVLPALLLNYFGQGALMIHNPAAVENPFYMLAPPWALYPMVALATLATVIASQAVISGAFSVTRQAIQLGYCPRLEVRHTSEREIGQVYLPAINWALLVAIVALVLGFRSSSNLAAAYGIAVTGTMAIDTILAVVVARAMWGWGWATCVAVAAFFLFIDLSFFSANAMKIPQGGWFPLVVGIAVFTLLSTWKRGRALLFDRLRDGAIALDPFLAGIAAHPPLRVPGTAVFLTANLDGVPHAMLHNLIHNKVLHERVVLLTVITEDVPHVPEIDHAEVQPLGNNFYRIIVRYGFKDEPDIPETLTQCTGCGLEFQMMETSFFISRETLIATIAPGMALWREKVFISMARNAGSVSAYFKIPTNRVVELGTQIEL
ncbi:K+ transporter [Sulfuricella denitrificans skB26]|uniref:Probable potassium transport system protein Kup n=1 Tax=Sulfuricella denitrificans (strain DSM 22764 / NBRC 105220 / skB26) TaxID=1163617 RepID=S6A9C4_SULDS|nr:potassium transporter Kup [Sulfuricella denitrificans]BAN33865.1 K+ transporter [Sulfuricella denitrificans skB26]